MSQSYSIGGSSDAASRCHYSSTCNSRACSVGGCDQVTFNRWRTVESGTSKYDEPEVENVTRVWHFLPRVVLFPCPTNDCVSCVLSYGQLQEFSIISGLQWRNVNEYRLPSKYVHSPNYCSWLAICVNYSANCYCKIALINSCLLYTSPSPRD